METSAAIYVRRSALDDREGDNRSLGAQERECRAWSERARGFLAGSTPGRYGLIGKWKNSLTFGILDGPLTLGIAQWFVPGGG